MKYDSGITRTGSEWELTHLCNKFGKDPCEYFLQTDNEKTVLNGKTLAPCSYYCTSENKVRKIGSGGTWTGLSPKFCPKRKEIFNKSEAAEQPSPQISYIDKLREKYPKVNETDDWFDTVYCPYELFVGKNVNNYNDDKCLYDPIGLACQECWREQCPPNIFFCENKDFEEEYFENYHGEAAPEVSESETTEFPTETAVTVPNENTEVPAEFDYSELDGDTAKNLRDCETVIRKETAGYFTLLGAKFKEAQELLADHANGTFEKWYAAMGFKRQTVYNLIRRYEFLNSPTIGGRTEAYSVERAAVDTVSNFRTNAVRGLIFGYEHDPLGYLEFMTVTLPSGRKLYYPFPVIAENNFGKPAVHYMGQDGNSKKWGRLSTYGGKLTENIVQAIARDCLAAALVRLDAAGYRTVMHIHDEAVIDCPAENANLEAVCKIMSQPIPWARGLLLNADGFVSDYYKKD